MLIDHTREKLLNLIAYFVKNTQKCGKTKLFKLHSIERWNVHFNDRQ